MNTRCITVALLSALALGACSNNAKKTDATKPVKLESFKPTLRIERVWHASVGGQKPKLRLGLGVAVDGTSVYAAGHKGDLVAFNLQNGRKLWSRDLRVPLSAGPGAGDGLVVAGSSGGTLIAVAASDGAERWRVQVSAELLATPVIGNGLVLVRTVDGRLLALDAGSGARRWAVDQQVPRLSLRGNGPPLISQDLAICGFDNGRLLAVTLSGGAPAWDVPVGQAHGSTEIQRLIDLDAPAVVDGDELFAVGYQGRVVRLARDSGQVLWARDMSSYRGLALSDDAVYVATSDGQVVRLDRRTGTEKWRQKALLRRGLSAPVVVDGRVVVGDYDGVVHWLDAEDGHFLARSKVGGRVSAPPRTLAGGQVLFFDDEGGLSVFRVARK
ncbi:MAG: outer membrane protein assembly factor BamB [Gammaproteobacteria bacterium]|nr:outer membrane protein assembly factor BamB [Gammaproteobacteria bacterium]